MKKATEIRYPNSSNLFQFCRRVLDHKFGGIRVIDQDVGQILGFDPADCSHWKKGKKNIRSIQSMKSIAVHLGVDERLVVDVASGELDENEAFFEYSGYGAFDVDPKILDNAKKEFYRRNAASWTKEKEVEFRNHFSANVAAVEKIVAEIHEKVHFQESPLYIPELLAAYPDIKLTTLATKDTDLTKNAKDTESNITVDVVRNGDVTEVNVTAGTEMKPYVRYRIAKAIAPHFLGDIIPSQAEFGEYAAHLADVQSNLFATRLLAPEFLIRKEMSQLNVQKDVVSQLAEAFWVSKTFMNRRLREILSM